MLGASLGDLRLALHGQAEEDARLAAATNGTAPAPNAETAATTASATQSTAKAGAATMQPYKAPTSEALSRIKPLYREPPSARVEISPSRDHTTAPTTYERSPHRQAQQVTHANTTFASTARRRR